MLRLLANLNMTQVLYLKNDSVDAIGNFGTAAGSAYGKDKECCVSGTMRKVS